MHSIELLRKQSNETIYAAFNSQRTKFIYVLNKLYSNCSAYNFANDECFKCKIILNCPNMIVKIFK